MIPKECGEDNLRFFIVSKPPVRYIDGRSFSVVPEIGIGSLFHECIYQGQMRTVGGLMKKGIALLILGMDTELVGQHQSTKRKTK